MSSSVGPETDIDVGRATRWLIGSAVVVFVCGIVAIMLPLTFSLGVAGLLGWLFIFAAVAHLIFGIHLGSGTLTWHAFIAALYALAAINLLVNPLLGVVLLALVIGVVLVAEGIIEIVLFFLLREYRHAVWILIDGVVTLVLGSSRAYTGHVPAWSWFNTLSGSVSSRAAFPVCCWASQFASRSEHSLRLHEQTSPCGTRES